MTLEVVKVQKDYTVLVKSLHVYIKMRCMQLFFNFLKFFFVCRMYKAEAGVICKKKSGIYKTIKTGVTIQFTQSGS